MSNQDDVSHQPQQRQQPDEEVRAITKTSETNNALQASKKSFFSRIKRTFLKAITGLIFWANPLTSFWTLQAALAIFAVVLPIMVPLFKNAIYGTAALAFFAFSARRYLELSSKRYNALCFLEVELNLILTPLHDNIHKIQNAISAHAMIPLNPSNVTVKPEIIDDISRADLKNELLDLIVSLRRLEHDLVYTDNNLRANAHEISTLKVHQDAAVYALGILLKGSEHVLEQTKQCAVLTRFYLKKSRPWIGAFQRFIFKPDLEDWRIADRERLEREILRDDKKA